jgi:predicted GH43/DUF377 family glycosyl hydrolase
MFTVKRSQENPLLSPKPEHPWEALAVFNGCPIKKGADISLLYRAMSNPDLLSNAHMLMSVIGVATSKDGVHFDDRKPLVLPDTLFDKYGCEDPRVTKIDDTYYIFYTGLSKFPFEGSGIKVGVALSKDLVTIESKHQVTPFNAKAMALFPEKINGKLMALLTPNTDSPPAEIALVQFEEKEDMWSEDFWNNWYSHLKMHIVPLRRHDDDQVELGAPPVKTEHGWLVIYSHISHYTDQSKRVFGVEAVLLDLENPQKILGRTNGSFLTPEMYYETTGVVPRVVFPSGALINEDVLEIYYGGADTHVCRAKVSLSHLINTLLHIDKLSFTRAPNNPILVPRKDKSWEELGVFNPAAIDIDGTVYILYRAATATNVSTFSLATSKDGITIDWRSEVPMYVARTEEEGVGRGEYAGCEDPRLSRIKDRIYMTYTGYNGSTPRIMISSIPVTDFVEKKFDLWSAPVAISPEHVDDKDACLVPKKFDKGYLILHRISHHVCADYAKDLDFSHYSINKCIDILSPRPGMWDGQKVGISGPPIEIEAGWILFYHGISDTGTYRMGAALLDKDDPTIVLSRTALPLFEPREEYEKNGIVPNVVFPCGNIVRGDTVYIYYGGADYVVAVATASLKEIVDMLTH